MLDQTIDLSTVTSVVRHGVETEVQEGTFSVGFAQFLNPDPATGRLVHVSGSSLHPLSYFFVDMQGRRQTGPYHEIQSMVHNTEPPCSRDYTRRECTPRHVEDCEYREPEPPHKLLPIGTRVLITPTMAKYPDGRIVYSDQPKVALIVGYDTFNSKYKIKHEKPEGGYYDFEMWATADNRVQPHPEQDGAAIEPTGPRIYVKNPRGKQGYILNMRMRSPGSSDRREAQVQWFAPGVRPVWIDMSLLTIITEAEVHRCPNGQTGDECGSGENQCELCLETEDEEGDAIERSMGLR